MIKGLICKIVGHDDEELDRGRVGDMFVACRRCGREQSLTEEYSRPPLDIPPG
jgi:hypothetical protein